jgi:predicted AAA+ superfamily ATPase
MSTNSNTKLIPRTIFPHILEWLDEREIIVITGARQTGKTTLLHKLQAHLKERPVVYTNFELPSQLENFTLSPTDFVSLQLSDEDTTYFLFDEFQYVERAGKILKLLFDQYEGQAKFIVTGSSSLAIKEIAGFLVGRAVFFDLYPFSFAEFLLAKDQKLHRLWQQRHDLLATFLTTSVMFEPEPKWVFQDEMEKHFDDYVRYGGYPAVTLSRPALKEKRLESLVDTYVQKDVVNFLRAGNALAFIKLVRLLALQLGNLVNFASLQSDADLSYREVRRFIDLMENTFILKLLRPYATNPSSEIKKSPKVYFVDTGLRNSLVSDFRPLDLRPDKGAMVENFAFNQLVAANKPDALRFWRTKQGAEVDFILLGPDQQLIAIEIKYRTLAKPTITASLAHFIKKYHPQKAVVLNRNLFATRTVAATEVLFLPVFFV